MMSFGFSRLAACAAIFIGLLAGTVPSKAQDRRQGEPGQFDYYVLVLSWSPSFCANRAERDPARSARDPQCGTRPFSFVVHGLWPQYERGFPEFCQVPAPRLNRNIVSGMLDLMPAPGLIFHEWDRHGTCSGLAPNAYFETIRKARAVVKIPPQYLDVSTTLTVAPAEVEEAFVKANPGLRPESIAISCGSRRLDEIKICMTRDLQFRGCEEVVRRTCRRDKVIMPPVRGG
jgi:ribonuclease T2